MYLKVGKTFLFYGESHAGRRLEEAEMAVPTNATSAEDSSASRAAEEEGGEEWWESGGKREKGQT